MKVVNYISRINETKCTGCGRCERVCPPAAITVIERLATVDSDKCLACNKCWHMCPEDAVSIVARDEELIVGTDFEEADAEAIDALCRKAHFFPEQFVCACTLTLAKELAAAIIQGAKTPEDVTAMTGVRSGCAIYCMGPVLRMLRAHGIKIEPPGGHRWYDLSLSLWDVPADVSEKHPEYYLKDDQTEFNG